MNKRHHILGPRDHQHLSDIGVPWVRPPHITATDEEYQHVYAAWKRTHPEADHETLHRKTLGHLAWHQHNKQKSAPVEVKALYSLRWELRLLAVAVILLLVYLVWPHKAHAQFSKISTIQFLNNNNSSAAFIASPFSFKAGANCTYSVSGSVITFNCVGGAAGAGGLNTQVQWNSTGALAGISSMTTDGTVVTQLAGVNYLIVDPVDPTKKFQFVVSSVGAGQTRSVSIPDANSQTIKAGSSTGQIPIWNNATSTYDVGDPFVSGASAVGAAPTENPVYVSGNDYGVGCGGGPCKRAFKVDASGNIYSQTTVTSLPSITFAAPQHVILDSGSIGNTSFAATGAATPGDGVANPTTAVITQSFLEAWNGATWDRVQLEGSNADTDPVDTTGSMATHSHNMMFNGTTWDRIRGDTTSGVWVNVKAAPANQSANIAQVAGGAVTATNVAITDAPLNMGAQAVTADNAAVTATRKVQLVADTTGKQIIMPYSNPENLVNGATSDITSTTATSIIAGVASTHLYITSFCVMNSHASVDTWVNLTEETSGTVLYTVFALHGGGGACHTLPVPIRLPTAAKALQATCVTTGANVRASAAGYKAVQ